MSTVFLKASPERSPRISGNRRSLGHRLRSVQRRCRRRRRRHRFPLRDERQRGSDRGLALMEFTTTTDHLLRPYVQLGLV